MVRGGAPRAQAGRFARFGSVHQGPGDSHRYDRVTTPEPSTHSEMPDVSRAVADALLDAPPIGPGQRRPTPPTRLEIEAMRRRDPEALGGLFDRYFDFLYALVHGLVARRELAEDITQDVFCKVYRSIESLDPARDPAPWLITVAVNACRDHWRRADTRAGRRSDPIDAPGLRDTLSAGGDDPESDYRRREQESLVRAALAGLPEALRTPIILRDFVGLDHQEIARATGISFAAARKRYSRGLAALAERLREGLS